MLKVGSKFYTFDELSRRLEEFQQLEQVQLWVRDSRTVIAAAKRARRKSLNPALKYAELTYSCVFGGRRPSDLTKIHNQTSAGGCPFKVRLSTSTDGQALVVKEICHDHNHEPGKKLHEESRRLYRNKANSRSVVRKPTRSGLNKPNEPIKATSKLKSQHHTQLEVSTNLTQSPFHHLQLHQEQQQLQIKFQLEQHLQQQRIKQEQLQEVLQLDSPDHIDTPDHLRSPDLSTSFESIGTFISTPDQYSYLPPSPISPSSSNSSSGQIGYTAEDEGAVEPIVDLEVALEEALGALDSVSSMDVEDKFTLTPVKDSETAIRSSNYTEPSLMAVPLSSSPSVSDASPDDDPGATHQARRFRGRARKHSTGESEKGLEDESKDFIGFSPVKTTQDTTDAISEFDIEQANTMAKQLHVFKPGISFIAGGKLEVLDARDNKWYPSRIVEVDWGELDILVHFDRWSVRFDEWLKMDSTRIRPLSKFRKDKKETYKIGEKVLGYWPLDSMYYLGEVIRRPSEDHYEILFYDGYTKCLRSGQIKKALPKDLESFVQFPMKDEPIASTSAPQSTDSANSHLYKRRSLTTPSTSAEALPAEPAMQKGWAYVHDTDKKNIFNVEILEEKRKKTRKPDVEELFKSLKRKRKLEEMLEGSKMHRPKESLRMSQSSLAQGSVPYPGMSQSSFAQGSVPYPGMNQSSSGQGLPCIELDLGYGWKKVSVQRPNSTHWITYYITPNNQKVKTRQQFMKAIERHFCPIEPHQLDFSYKTAKFKYEGRPSNEDIKPDFNATNRSEGLFEKEVEERASEFPPAKKIKLEEERKPFATPSKHQSYEDTESSSSESSFSSSLDEDEKSPKENSAPEDEEYDNTSSSSSTSEELMDDENQSIPTVKLSDLLTKASKKTPVKEKDFPSIMSPEGVTKDCKTIMPSASTAPVVTTYPPLEITQHKHWRMEPDIPPVGEFRMSEKSHKCPVKNCEKSFRKESLLQMHLKHYHPEHLKKKSVQVPNVADLAYARTVGEHLESSLASPTSSVLSPSSHSITELPSKKPRIRNPLSMSAASKYFQADSEESALSDEEHEDDERLAAPEEEMDHEMNDDAKKRGAKVVTRSMSSELQRRKFDSMSEMAETEDEPGDYEDAIINCGCKSIEEDGLMLQCDVCLCWQHGGCYNIHKEAQVPENYICSLCENPRGERSTMRFRHHQDWLKEGKLPRFSFATGKPGSRLQSFMKRGHELEANVLQLSELIHSLKLKLSIAKETDHPKFVMWHKKWEEPPADNFDIGDVSETRSLPQPSSDTLTFSEPSIIQSSDNGPETSASIASAGILQTEKSHVVTDIPISDSVLAIDSSFTSIQPVPSTILNSSITTSLPQAITSSSDAETENNIISVTEKEERLEFLPKADSIPLPEHHFDESLTDNEAAKLNSQQTFSVMVPGEETLGNAVQNGTVFTEEQLNQNTETDIQIDFGPLLPSTSTAAAVANDTSTTLSTPSPPEAYDSTDLKTCSTIVGDLQTKVTGTESCTHIENYETKVVCISEEVTGQLKSSKIEEKEIDIMTDVTGKDTDEKSYEGASVPSTGEPSLVAEDKIGSVSLESGLTKLEPVRLEEPRLTSNNKKTELEDTEANDQVQLEEKDARPSVVPLGSEPNPTASGSIDQPVHKELMEVPEDFDIELGGLGGSTVTSINDGADLAALLSHPSLEHFVDQASKELTPLNNPPIIPQAERIEPASCRLNLLRHVESMQNKVFKQFDYIEKELQALEAEMGLTSELSREEQLLLKTDNLEERDAATIQARSLVQLILRDLDTVKKLSSFSGPK